MIRARSLNAIWAVLFGLLAAANAFAQGVKIGGEDADVFFAVTGANKNVRLVPAPPDRSGSNGQLTIPPEVTSEFKHFSTAKIYYRRNKCMQRKEAVIASPEVTATEIQAEEKSKGQDCGAYMLLGDNVSWASGRDLRIDYSGETPLVTSGRAMPSSSSSNHSNGASGFTPSIQLRGFGGVSFINGNTPASAGFDGAVLFPLGNRILVGPNAGFQWVDTSLIRMIGSMTAGSTFVNATGAFKNGNFGGQFGFSLSGYQLGLRAGATVAGSAITQKSGFCAAPNATNPTGGCVVSSTTMTHDTVVGPFVGGYISHSIFSHVGVFVEYDYARLKDQTTSPTSGAKVTVFDVHGNNLIGGFVVTFGRHAAK